MFIVFDKNNCPSVPLFTFTNITGNPHVNLLPDCLSACPSAWQSFYLSVYLYICLSICMSVSLTICLSVCLSVCLSTTSSESAPAVHRHTHLLSYCPTSLTVLKIFFADIYTCYRTPMNVLVKLLRWCYAFEERRI